MKVRDIIVEYSGQQPDMFQSDFATKRTKIKNTSANGVTWKDGNVNSNGGMIALTVQSLSNFWRWFSNSKAVDHNGRPLVFFHGTNSDFNEFKTQIKTYNNYGLLGDVEVTRSAIFVTPDVSFASGYTRTDKPGANIISVYARAINPIDLRRGISYNDFDRLTDIGFNARFILNSNSMWEIFDDEDGSATVEAFKRLGHDSAIISEDGVDVWVLFSSSQLKSVYGNVGTFKDSGNITEDNASMVISESFGKGTI